MLILRNIETFSLFLTTLIGLVLYFKIKHKSISYYVVWLVFAAIAELTLQLFYDVLPEGKMVRITYAILAPINLILFYKIFELRFKNERMVKLCFRVIMVSFCLYSFYNLIFQLDNAHSFDNTFLVLSFIILLITLRYFLKLFSQKDVYSLSDEPLFWLATGILFYFASNIFSTGFFHILNEQNQKLSLALYNINYIVGIFYNILGGVAIILSLKKQHGRN